MGNMIRPAAHAALGAALVAALCLAFAQPAMALTLDAAVSRTGSSAEKPEKPEGPAHDAGKPLGSDSHAALVSTRFGCLVCHDSTSDVFGLLEGRHSRVGDATDEACVGCHTGGGPAPQVYGGSAANYSTRSDHGHNDPAKVSCIDCHSIHGPVFQGSGGIAGKLLKKLDYQREAVRTYDFRTASRDEALAVWCTGCHKDSWPRGDAAGGKGPRSPAAYDAHPLKKADGTIAFGDATSCRSCHAAGSPDGIGRGDFPHFTPGAARMLVGADSASGEVVGMSDADSDGVCLRCHRTGAGPGLSGVGVTY